MVETVGEGSMFARMAKSSLCGGEEDAGVKWQKLLVVWKYRKRASKKDGHYRTFIPMNGGRELPLISGPADHLLVRASGGLTPKSHMVLRRRKAHVLEPHTDLNGQYVSERQLCNPANVVGPAPVFVFKPTDAVWHLCRRPLHSLSLGLFIRFPLRIWSQRRDQL